MTPSIDQLAERGGDQFYRWFNPGTARKAGAAGDVQAWLCVLIIYSVIDSESNIAYIVVGAVLIGLVPVDQWLQRLPTPGRKEADDAGHPPS